ncbi:YqiA/YcfP family alpha/beta fold hydrolase [Peribacillus deserti]|nr:YqiA/YcfP family alpha/beta fold hydrolase [Peribacillus deserti]
MPIGTVKDKVYHQLSNAAYNTSHRPKVDVKIGSEIQTWTQVKNNKFVTHDNTGFDAKVFERKGEIVIAFRGTEKTRLQDIVTDAAYIANTKAKPDVALPWLDKVDKYDITEKMAKVASRIPHPAAQAAAVALPHLKQNQFDSAEQLVKQVKKEYPNAHVSVTGHSLGGAEAGYTGAVCDVEAVTFNAPSVVHLLPEDMQKKVKKGYYDRQIVNYVNPKDSVGAGAIHPYERHIGSTYYIGTKFALENANSTVLGRARDSFTGPARHHLRHFLFDNVGNINNPLLMNALSGHFEYQSPRFGGETATIDLTPGHLGDLSTKLLEASQGVEDATNKIKKIAYSMDRIKIYAGLQNDVLQESHFFYSWFDHQTNKMANDMKSAKDLFVKADKLP